MRELGIPTVLDRFIQQALMQVLQPQLDPTFSEHSYGSRPGRRAHDAVRAARRYVQEGRRIVVDVDLEKFFDRVNHDVLMGKLANRIADRRLLGSTRRYLEAGVMLHGVVVERHEGTPQGGHRLRAIHLEHGKRGRVTYREPRARGLSDERARQVAANGRRWVEELGYRPPHSLLRPARCAAAGRVTSSL